MRKPAFNCGFDWAGCSLRDWVNDARRLKRAKKDDYDALAAERLHGRLHRKLLTAYRLQTL